MTSNGMTSASDAKAGHNSMGTAGDRLKSFIERIERLQAEKAALQEDIKEIFSEAKATGFDPKIMRVVIQKRKMDAADLAEREAMIELYENALGMLKDTPLGDATMRAAGLAQ